MTKKIGVLIGSLRKGSYNRQLANNMIALFPEGYEAQIIEIGDLALYNQDFDDLDQAPQSYATFRNTAKDFDAFMFLTPEYNRSVPAVLKNALDVGSRPYGQSVWDNKPALVVSSSIGVLSGFGANQHLRQSLVFLNMPTLQQPEAYIATLDKLLDENGKINNEGTVKFLQSIVDAFITLINRY